MRLLSRLARIEVTESRQTPAVRLGQWMGWTESIVLSKALTAAVPAFSERDAGPGATPGQGAGLEEGDRSTSHPVAQEVAGDAIDVVELAAADYTQVRQALEQAIGAAVAPPAPVSSMQRRQLRGGPKPMADVDFPSYRRRYSLLQQKMEDSITALRGRLRALVAVQSPEMARLAAVDVAMEQALMEQELRLLAGIPGLLEDRFGHLLREGQVQAPVEPGPWLDAFRDDMRSVLLAELELRLQPVEGLLSAIRGK